MYKKITFTLACLLAVGTISACADVEVNEPDGQLESLQQQIATLESELEEERNRVPETVVVPLSDEHNSLQDSIAAVEQERDDLSAELDILENEVLALQLERDDIQQEYDDFQASMAPFVELSPEQAEAILLALDEEEAARQAEAAEKEKLGYETGITYDQLARTPDDYVGDLVKFTGEVLQVTEGDGYAHYRIAVNGNYDQVLFVQIDSSLTQNNRILEDDEITIFGESYGLHTYQSALGGDITIPAIIVDRFEPKGAHADNAGVEVKVPSGGPIQLNQPFTLGDYELTIISFDIVNDYDGMPCLKYVYDWTNNSDETTYASITFDLMGFQDGVETSDHTIIFGDVDLGIGQREVKPGGRITNAEGSIGIDDLNKPIFLEITEWFSYDSDVVYTYEIADLNNLP